MLSAALHPFRCIQRTQTVDNVTTPNGILDIRAGDLPGNLGVFASTTPPRHVLGDLESDRNYRLIQIASVDPASGVVARRSLGYRSCRG